MPCPGATGSAVCLRQNRHSAKAWPLLGRIVGFCPRNPGLALLHRTRGRQKFSLRDRFSILLDWTADRASGSDRFCRVCQIATQTPPVACFSSRFPRAGAFSFSAILVVARANPPRSTSALLADAFRVRGAQPIFEGIYTIRRSTALMLPLRLQNPAKGTRALLGRTCRSFAHDAPCCP